MYGENLKVSHEIGQKRNKRKSKKIFLTIWKVEKRVIVAVNNIIMVDIKTIHKREKCFTWGDREVVTWFTF